MTDLGPHLERLGLEQYLDAFLGEGFDTWETLLDIQESDLYVVPLVIVAMGRSLDRWMWNGPADRSLVMRSMSNLAIEE